MNGAATPAGEPSFNLVECSLYAEFEVALPPIDWCPLVEFEPPISVRDQQFHDGTCLIDARVREDGELRTVRIRQDCDGGCPSEVLTGGGYVPQLKEIQADRVVIGVHLEERSEVTDVVDRLRSVANGVNLRQLVRIDRNTSSETALLDLTTLTETQRETVTLAISRGYYRQPRQASISDLADELGISTPAVSQRLSAAESKVMRTLFESLDDCDH